MINSTNLNKRSELPCLFGHTIYTERKYLDKIIHFCFNFEKKFDKFVNKSIKLSSFLNIGIRKSARK